MIQTFVEKNRKLLHFYYWAARISGWAFISISLLAFFGHSVALASRMGDRQAFNAYLPSVPWGMFNNVLPTGLLVLGLAQLIGYLHHAESKAGWILCHSDKLVYVYAAILLGYFCFAGGLDVVRHYHEPHDFPLRLIFIAMFVLVKLLLLIGLAQMVKRLLPIIEESRTLV